MTFAPVTIADFAAAETLLVSIPESVGLLVFGVALVVVAVVMRNFISLNADKETVEKVRKV